MKIEGYGADSVGQLGGFCAEADEPTFCSSDIVQNGFKFAGVVWVGSAIGLDLDRDLLRAALDDEIGFLACGGTPEKELRERAGEAFPADEVLDDESFPG